MVPCAGLMGFYGAGPMVGFSHVWGCYTGVASAECANVAFSSLPLLFSLRSIPFHNIGGTCFSNYNTAVCCCPCGVYIQLTLLVVYHRGTWPQQVAFSRWLTIPFRPARLQKWIVVYWRHVLFLSMISKQRLWKRTSLEKWCFLSYEASFRFPSNLSTSAKLR